MPFWTFAVGLEKDEYQNWSLIVRYWFESVCFGSIWDEPD